MIVQIVRFKSGLAAEEVLKRYQARAPRYRAVKGLKQKYYLRFPDTNEHGAVYIWESEPEMNLFRKSDLGRTLSTTYQIEEAADIRVGEVLMTLRPG